MSLKVKSSRYYISLKVIKLKGSHLCTEREKDTRNGNAQGLKGKK